MSKFKVGDKVRCINNGLAEASLEKGKVYEISGVSITGIGDGTIQVAGIKHSYVWWLVTRFELIDDAPACVMTQDHFAALKVSLETLKKAHPNSWENRNSLPPHSSIANFFRDMDNQGLLSDPKPKTAREIAEKALNKAPPPGWGTGPYNELRDALKAIAELP